MVKNKSKLQDLELSILRNAVDKIEANVGMKKIQNPEITAIIKIVEDFIQKKKRICYGGTAINNILPEKERFYNKDIELPDYDFFSPNPLKDSKQLADIYYKKGYTEVVAKAGVHTGTFKVFVNYLPIADITYIVPELYNNLLKKSVNIAGIRYCPPNYLRMLMYLELSRPLGDVSRWEKVLKRLTILNRNYPLTASNCDINAIQRIFERGYKTTSNSAGFIDDDTQFQNLEEKIFLITRETLSTLGCIFFGAFANRLYLKNTKELRKKPIPKIPDFDVLSENPQKTATILKERLIQSNIKNITIVTRAGVGDIIAPHYEVKTNNETIVFIYEPLSCHSYNVHKIGGNSFNIATLDTMLSFYLAFMFTNRPYYNEKRILCMSKYLFDVQEKNKLEQKGLLKRFTMNCYGDEHTIENIRRKKSELYKMFKSHKTVGGKSYDWHFLNYEPSKNKRKGKTKKKKKKKRKRKTKKVMGIF